MTRVDSIIVDLEAARAATDAYAKKHGLDQKYEDPRLEVEDDQTFADLTDEEHGKLVDLCDVRHASDDEFFRTVEYLLKVNPRFVGLVVGDMLARHLKRRKTFRQA